jgi:hypothetical protein
MFEGNPTSDFCFEMAKAREGANKNLMRESEAVLCGSGPGSMLVAGAVGTSFCLLAPGLGTLRIVGVFQCSYVLLWPRW